MLIYLSFGVRAIVAACGFGVGASCALAGEPPFFLAIPGLPGDNPVGTDALGVSPDGNVVFGGVRTVGRFEAMTWTRDGGTVAHGEGSFYASSYDGSVMAGGLAGRWTAASGFVRIPGAGGIGFMDAIGVSGDGQTLLGTQRTADNQRNAAARWTPSGGAEFLPPPPSDPGPSSYATRSSFDGSFIVGSGGLHGAWATDTVTTRLVHPLTSDARALTPDGRFLVGAGGGNEPGYRYDFSTDTLLELPPVPGQFRGAAVGISADGSIIVGNTGSTARPYIWEMEHGSRELATVFTQELGLDLGGFVLINVTGISDDGRTLAGLGRNAEGREQAWVAVIPSPTGVAIVAPLFAFCGRRRRE
jgi:uncharacterized membrane protein